MKKFLPIAMAAVMSMSAVAVSAVSANAAEPLNTPVQYAQVARASLATPKISKAESVYGGVKLTWNKVNGAAKYRVYYKGRKGYHFNLIYRQGCFIGQELHLYCKMYFC